MILYFGLLRVILLYLGLLLSHPLFRIFSPLRIDCPEADFGKLMYIKEGPCPGPPTPAPSPGYSPPPTCAVREPSRYDTREGAHTLERVALVQHGAAEEEEEEE